MWLIIDKIKEKFLRNYRKKVFLARISCRNALDCRVLGKVTVLSNNIKIGNNVTIYPDVLFWGDGEIVIGNNVDIGKDTVIFSHNKVSIGDNTSIAAQCFIIDSNHGFERNKLIREQPLNSKEIIIGEDVWIASGCKIIKGAEIKDGSVIGAMSLVNSLIDENTIAVGVPAKVIKRRI
ncbi:acyltransferase [Paenibacillus sp. BAC0078]